MDLADLIVDRPRLFLSRGGELVSYAVPDQLLDWLAAHIDESSHTLETGAGVSTLLFALCHTHHTAVAPDPALMERITRYCAVHGLASDRLTLLAGPSETILPALPPGPPLDLVLIDGRHGFPAPFIDWYYTEPRLKIGGLLVVDDIQLWTGAVLRDFLRGDPAWRPLTVLAGKTAIFSKLKAGSASLEWCDQPTVIAASRRLQRLSRLSGWASYLLPRNWRYLKARLRALRG